MTSNPVINWTVIISAVLGLVGGGLSGGFAAYTQLRASQEQFSIERARMFKELIVELQDENTARMALLNLWQLYPNERDQKIIVAAAIESGQPDLVETIIGFEDELVQLAGILQAKAVAGEGHALQTLMRIDPARAAQVIVDTIHNDIRLAGDRFVTNDMIRDLKRLTQTNESTVDIIRSKIKELPEAPLLFDYLLYDAGADSHFVKRVETAYRERTELRLFNQFLSLANFKIDDAPRIVASAREFVVDALTDSESNEFALGGALGGLKNNSLARQLDYKDNRVLATSLSNAVADPESPDLVRQRALALLRKISGRQALLALARALREGSAGSSLIGEIKRQLDRGLIALLEDEDSSFTGPRHCAEVETGNCIDQSEAWGKWLDGMANQ
jgi:hypothetical protein